MLRILEGGGIYSPMVKGNDISEPKDKYDSVEFEENTSVIKQAIPRLEIDETTEQVAVIGDIHGTTKFIDGYMDILKNNNHVSKIIVLGDHFDPYEDISVDVMIERYTEFLECMREDDRIISLIGNHDLATYIIESDCTNRTEHNFKNIEKISNIIRYGLDKSYLVYKYGNFLFSHAGVSSNWVNTIADQNGYSFNDILKLGWTEDELKKLCKYYEYDFSGYGNNKFQSPVWIRPEMLKQHPYGKFNQVVGHTRLANGGNFPKERMVNQKYVWFSDNSGSSEYLLLDIN